MCNYLKIWNSIFKKLIEGNFFVKLLKIDTMELLTFDAQIVSEQFKKTHFDGIFLNISCSWLVGLAGHIIYQQYS